MPVPYRLIAACRSCLNTQCKVGPARAGPVGKPLNGGQIYPPQWDLLLRLLDRSIRAIKRAAQVTNRWRVYFGQSGHSGRGDIG